MSVQKRIHGYDTEFSTNEWWRLSDIAIKYESRMRLAYTRAMVDGVHINKLQLRKVIIDCLSETCISSAQVYNLVFNPNSSIYVETVDTLTDKYANTVDSPTAREAVKRILPKGLSLEDRNRRSNTFGLDTKSALDVERYRQRIGDSEAHIRDTAKKRAAAIRLRGNRLATTETNRVVNAALEALWLDNQDVSKSDITFYDRTIRDFGNVPKRARKIIITRRDGRVCEYCDSLDGLKARIGKDFDTEYGLFSGPPFHPNCRCYLFVSTK